MNTERATVRLHTTRGRQPRLATLALTVCALGVAWPAGALMTAGPVVVVNPNAATDDPEGDVNELPGSVVATGSGSFVLVYSSNDDLGGTIGMDNDLLAVRSTDGGRTWSSPVPANSNAASDGVTGDDRVSLAADGPSVVVAVWEEIGGDKVFAARSLDQGQNWSAPADLLAVVGVFPDVAVSGTTSVAVWRDEDVPGYGSDEDAFFVRSTDAGLTWSAPAPIDTGASSDGTDEGEVHVATDGMGRWVAVWQREFEDIYASRSVDDGATWSTPVVLGPAGDTYASLAADLAVDAAGRFVAVWVERGVVVEGAAGSDSDLVVVSSSDAGATWTSPKAMLPDAATDVAFEASPEVAGGGPGVFAAVWYGAGDSFGGTKGTDEDIFVSRSVDGGVTWSPRALLNTNGLRDRATGFDGSPKIASDGGENWVVTWLSSDSLGGTIGEDFDVFSTASHDDCAPSARMDCTAALSGGGARLSMKDGPEGNDSLVWSWKGEDTVAADLGDPTVSGGYALCVYGDVSAELRPVLELDAAGGQLCAGGSACWKTTNTGHRYKDGATWAGATKGFRASASAGDRGKFTWKASGPVTALPRLPLDIAPPLRVQMVNVETDRCWEGVFSTALTNNAERFKARSD